ncbi:alpha/beta hydrolase [Phenylobacterium aquaticum]|uniref:alpha/beta hydrolase n=1 Tax=Phenylobacterium aquaticum TaxID=1763816 RepID=UPI001F5DCBCE|nr:alpha/beta fold hydrolase [Phenylobacterium aquaticum]MCI3135164.1 alpha/beta fold hydrolase [Phenylobacterium aquaticum]
MTAQIRDFRFRLDAKSGKAVLLIHGLTGAPGEMKFLARRLHKRGLSVAAPLLAGHGLDEAHLLRTDWRDWRDSLLKPLEELRADHDEVYVAGICVGGALGLALAAEAPSIKAAAVYSMTYRYDGWNMRHWYSPLAPFIEPFAGLPLIRRLSFEEPYPFGLKDERLRDGMTATQGAVIPGALDRLPLGAMAEMYRLTRHLDEIGSQIRLPTLLIHARDDDMAHPRNSERLQKALGGPTELHLLEDCYHMVHVDLQRDLVADLTADFFGAAPIAARFARPYREPVGA